MPSTHIFAAVQVKSFTVALLISLICVNIFFASDTAVIQLFNKKGVVVNPLCQKRSFPSTENTLFHSDTHPVNMVSNTYCHWCFEITFWNEEPYYTKFIKQNTFSYLGTVISVFSDKDHPPPKHVA